MVLCSDGIGSGQVLHLFHNMHLYVMDLNVLYKL